MGNDCCSAPQQTVLSRQTDMSNPLAIKRRKQERKLSVRANKMNLGPNAEGLSKHY